MKALSGENVDDYVNCFYDKSHLDVQLFVPLSKQNHGNHPQVLVNLKNKKNKAYKQRYLVCGLSTDYVIYSNYRRQICAETKTSYYKNYVFKTQRNLTSEPTKFWSFVNAKKETVGFPSSMTFNLFLKF